MIRVFITAWSHVGNEITNPIRDYIMAQGAAGTPLPVIASMCYPDRDINGIPDKPQVLVFVEGPATFNGHNLEDFQNLAGVVMIPPYTFDTLISTISTTTVNQIKTYITNQGIPLSALSGVVTWGDFLKKVAKYFSVNFQSFGQYETIKSADFA